MHFVMFSGRCVRENHDDCGVIRVRVAIFIFAAKAIKITIT